MIDTEKNRILSRNMTQAIWNSGQKWNQSGLVWSGKPSTKGTTMNSHVSLGFKSFKDAGLIPFAQGVHDDLLTNAVKFPTLPVGMPAFQTAITDFTVKLDLAHKGSVASTQAKNAARETLVIMLSQLAAYVESIALGDPAVMHLGGFDDVSHGHAPQTALVKPEISKALSPAAGKVQLRCKRQPNVRAVRAQFRTNGGAWQEGGSFNSPRAVVVENLASATMHDFRVQYLGGSTNASEWSDVVSHLCT